jgi:fatty-acid desaturase
VPAILIIATKVIGVLVLNSVYDLDISIGNDTGQFFTTQIYISSEKDALLLNSFTDAFTLAAISLPLLYMLVKVFVQKQSQKDPRTVVKLTKANLLKWVTKEDISFLRIFVWTAFLWMVSALIIVNTINGNSYLTVGVVAGVLVLISTWGVLRVFEIDSNKVYPE